MKLGFATLASQLLPSPRMYRQVPNAFCRPVQTVFPTISAGWTENRDVSVFRICGGSRSAAFSFASLSCLGRFKQTPTAAPYLSHWRFGDFRHRNDIQSFPFHPHQAAKQIPKNGSNRVTIADSMRRESATNQLAMIRLERRQGALCDAVDHGVKPATEPAPLIARPLARRHVVSA